MQLEFTEEQEELRDSVRAMLARECPMSLVREIVEKRIVGGDASAERLWSQMVELGWPALTVPTACGGLGLGAVEVAVVGEELGRVMTPGPFLPTVTQFVPAVLEAGSPEQHTRFLGAVAAGEITGTLAVAEATGSFDVADVTAVATPHRDGYTLAGTKRFVFEPVGDAVEIVVAARLAGTGGPDGVGAFVVPGTDVGVTPMKSLDPSRVLATVRLDGVWVDASRVLGRPGPDTAAALRRAVEEATAALAIEVVGTCQTIFDVALEYAKQREQFGVAIGSFQAIKHKFADMLVALERARATGYFAALTIAEDDDRRTSATSMAKAAAGDAQRLIAKEGIQILGGIGYTWEHDMHLYVRHVKGGAALLGTATTHRARVAELLGL